MDGSQFDALASRLSASLNRRRSLGVLGVLGVAGASLATKAVAKKKKKKGNKGKGGKKKPQNRCSAQPTSQTCAGKCGSFTDNCGTTVSCSCPAGQCCNGKGACGACLTFRTSKGYRGNFEGLTGADATCQGLANTAGLPGTYMAWLSDTTGSPSTRFTKASVPYTLVDGTVVANNWEDLINGSLAHAITLTETGTGTTSQVWTNTKADGTPGSTRPGTPSGGQHCENWTMDYFQVKGYLGIPHPTALGSWWTDFEERPCADVYANGVPPYGLYCFQQR